MSSFLTHIHMHMHTQAYAAGHRGQPTPTRSQQQSESIISGSAQQQGNDKTGPAGKDSSLCLRSLYAFSVPFYASPQLCSLILLSLNCLPHCFLSLLCLTALTLQASHAEPPPHAACCPSLQAPNHLIATGRHRILMGGCVHLRTAHTHGWD